MKKNRMNVIMTLAFASALSVGVAVSALNNVTAKAENEAFYIAGGAVKYVEEGSQENGIRFAVALEGNESEGGLFKDLTSEGAFKDNVTVGGIVAPSDLFTGELTTETVLADSQAVAPVTFEYGDFKQGKNEEAGYMLAYVTLYNFEEGNYNRDFTVRAYYEIDGIKTYSDSRTACMAQIAKAAIEAGDENADKLQEYLKNYKVSFMVDGEELSAAAVKYGEKIDQSELPTIDASQGKYMWYADAEYKTAFDFETTITGSTKVYGKLVTIEEQTGGLFVSHDETYSYSNGVMTQTLKNSSAKQGLATFNVEAGDDFYVSADLNLKNYMKVASQAWEDNKNDRIGMALINANGENYRIQMRTTMLVLYKYAKATALYNDDNRSATYLLGSTNGTSNEVYNGETPYLQLKNTSNMNSIPNISFSMSKIGTTLTFCVNDEVAYTQEVEADFNGVPALFAYTFSDPATQVVTYSNIVVKTGSEAQPWGSKFTSMTQDYTATGADDSLKLTQALPTNNQNGLAYFKVNAGEDFYIAFTAKLSTVVGTATQTWGTGAMAQVGLAYINQTTNENYRYMFRGTLCGLINYDKSTELYDTTGATRTAGKNVIYLFGPSNSNPTKNNWTADKWASMDGDSFKELENQASGWGINSSSTFNFAYKKVGNQMSVWVNDYLVNTYTLEDNFQGVPALLAYSLNSTAKSHTYSNIVIKTGAEVNA